ncbi:UDP-2,3-diacylglucosamine diphosphatase [Ruficoccus sp. ZRK36]|uniref:UDP-2,3-diacylglucosamine diphosphatase n=1 Tax=Ruficoccus sp. ZRK36 TaxID=2866311 RepID=UPI001C72FB7C|nr:UDP-2,3-diacylglucosamine diphosphatase [Ruficoccus sp. ZRK36]QYY36203.1 UDP-2,3-diacylglucosamine diphosphatase [Ruficoccus sp. ZRK36]
MKKPVLKFKSVILSDVHLGTPDCKIDEVNHFLKHTRCERLILNGDIIDGWSLKRKLSWEKGHTKFVRRILKIAEKKDTDVIYIRGNHDDFLANYLPLVFDRIQLVEEYTLKTSGGDYLCIHGDCFDAITTHSKFISILGDIGYQSLLKFNRYYNKYRSLRGKEYFSVSKAIKAKVKNIVNHISDFEKHLQSLAEKRQCVGIICGHIHTAEDKMIGDIRYLNSGDWVESMTAIVEHFDGRFELIDYKEFCERLEAKSIAQAQKKADRFAAANAAQEQVLWLSEDELAQA